ncbi:uncharacterized protein LOC111121650 [Crassostrea virginica]|uniref:Uncharacterized protein LOC111121650 n=1 Tax=Crassostrea virginica TaxID=6565 RepID=A0A8B8CU19_CRAVI|nr:uncharacterized protein LOC111121650 [Crassostrea virginica]
MPNLTHILFRRPAPFHKKGQIPRAPKARIAGVPVLRNQIGTKDTKGFSGHCNTEMQNMLSCLKKEAFVEAGCDAEILSYNTCIKKAIESERIAKKNKFEYRPMEDGRMGQRIPAPAINKVMARTPIAKYKSFKNVK